MGKPKCISSSAQKKKKKWFEHALTLHYQSYNSLSIQKMQEEIQLLHVPVYLVRS